MNAASNDTHALSQLTELADASQAILAQGSAQQSAAETSREPGRAMPEKLNVPDIIHLTGRLSQLLKEEVVMLEAMKIDQVKELQQEKQFLTSALEGHRRLLAKNPKLRDTVAAQERDELEGVVRVFEDILAENHRRLLIAREANHRIVKTITKVVRESASGGVYDGNGSRGMLGGDALSLTLNQTA